MVPAGVGAIKLAKHNQGSVAGRESEDFFAVAVLCCLDGMATVKPLQAIAHGPANWRYA